ncbi:MAG: 3-oxoacyl-ACP synthase III family protein [Thermoguttaceae bacterium]
MKAHLLGIQYYLPSSVRTNHDLAASNPGWDADKIFQKTGIRQRCIAGPEETAADLAWQAATRLFEELSFDRAAVDALLFCTQSQDYPLPTTACMLQDRLKLPTTCGALDYDLGCSGFTYGLWLARSMILSGSAANVLLLTAETYSKYCDIHDMATATIFGDGGAAALIGSSSKGALAEVGPTVVGTDGRGWANLIVRNGASRHPRPSTDSTSGGDERKHDYLSMNGPEIFRFTLDSVHTGIQQLLDTVSLAWESVDVFLMHQANRFMLESLRDTMKIPPEKMPIDLADHGNTVSASIPILMRRCFDRGTLKNGQKCVLAGFGVGYSWAMTELNWLAART